MKMTELAKPVSCQCGYWKWACKICETPVNQVQGKNYWACDCHIEKGDDNGLRPNIQKRKDADTQ